MPTVNGLTARMLEYQDMSTMDMLTAACLIEEALNCWMLEVCSKRPGGGAHSADSSTAPIVRVLQSFNRPAVGLFFRAASAQLENLGSNVSESGLDWNRL